MEHFLTTHKDKPLHDLNIYREFRGFHVELGGGHYELNCRRSFLCDKIGYETFVKQSIMSTGFTEVQARHQATARDNHK